MSTDRIRPVTMPKWGIEMQEGTVTAWNVELGRHVDKETGVGPWFKPFTAEYDFTFAGTGKKGGY